MNCANPECNKQFLCSEENEYKYMRSCSDACRVDVRNLYIKEHNLSDEDVQARMQQLEKHNLVTQ